MIYEVIEGSEGFSRTKAQREPRRRMNIPFIIKNNDTEINRMFLKEAETRKLIHCKATGLYGHESEHLQGYPLQG